MTTEARATGYWRRCNHCGGEYGSPAAWVGHMAAYAVAFGHRSPEWLRLATGREAALMGEERYEAEVRRAFPGGGGRPRGSQGVPAPTRPACAACGEPIESGQAYCATVGRWLDHAVPHSAGGSTLAAGAEGDPCRCATRWAGTERETDRDACPTHGPGWVPGPTAGRSEKEGTPGVEAVASRDLRRKVLRAFVAAVGDVECVRAYGPRFPAEHLVDAPVFLAAWPAQRFPIARGFVVLTPEPSEAAAWVTTGVWPDSRRRGFRVLLRDAAATAAFSGDPPLFGQLQLGVLLTNQEHLDRCWRESAGLWKYSGVVWYPSPGYAVFTLTREAWRGSPKGR